MLYQLKMLIVLLSVFAFSGSVSADGNGNGVDPQVVCDTGIGNTIGAYLDTCRPTAPGAQLCPGSSPKQNHILLYSQADACWRSEPEDIGNINGAPFQINQNLPSGGYPAGSGPTVFCAGQPVAVAAVFLPDADITTASFDILWGDDGQNVENINQAVGAPAVVPHVYQFPGEYIAALFATTTTGRQKQAEVAVTVLDCQ